MYKEIGEFITDWQAEAELTLKVFAALSDEFLLKSAGENVRTPGRLAWHITQTLTEMPHKSGVLDQDALDAKPIPATSKEIQDQYANYSKALVNALQERWSNGSLEDKVDMYGQQWAKSQVLSVLIRHQIHHRAQLMTVMRLLGLKVPGIYGPAKEEWSMFGMEAQE